MLGAIYERQKEYDKAEQQFRKVLEVNPNNAAVLNYYGYMLADRGVRVDEGISLIQRAVDSGSGQWRISRQSRLGLLQAGQANRSGRKSAEGRGQDRPRPNRSWSSGRSKFETWPQ